MLTDMVKKHTAKQQIFKEIQGLLNKKKTNYYFLFNLI